MSKWKRYFSWMEHCPFSYHVNEGVIKDCISKNPLIYKVLEIANNVALVSMKYCGRTFYYTFSLAKKPLMGMISCMPVGTPYLQKKRALGAFEHFKKIFTIQNMTLVVGGKKNKFHLIHLL